MQVDDSGSRMPVASEAIRPNGNLIRREMRGGHWFYVKQYAVDDWDASRDVILQRLELETRTLKRVALQKSWPCRLGRLRLESADIEQGIITTEEVLGKPLDEWTRAYQNEYYSHCLMMFYLAGRWIRHFQRIEMSADDLMPIGDKNSLDMTEYITIRISALRECGYRGLSSRELAAVIERTKNLVEGFDDSDRKLVLCHNDYSPGNIISDGFTLTPIDFQMAGPGNSLQDASYFLHRMEMLRIYRPWLIRPWSRWKESFERGFGRGKLSRSPLYKAMAIRLLVLRLLTYSKRKPSSRTQAAHDRWVLWVVRQKLLKAVMR